MLRTGRVVSAKNGQIEVCFERPEACASCGACRESKEHSLVSMPGDAKPGQWVDVDMPEKQVLKASIIAYGVPLLLLLAGILLGKLLFVKEEFWALTGLVCMGIGWLVLRLIENTMKKRPGWQPRVLAVHDEPKAEK